MLKSTSPIVGGSLDSFIFGCYARVIPRVTSHMCNALTLSNVLTHGWREAQTG